VLFCLKSAPASATWAACAIQCNTHGQPRWRCIADRYHRWSRGTPAAAAD
jgi:hypothetical protein